MTAHLTNEQRQLVFRLRHRGLTTVAIAREIGLTWEGAAAVLRGQKREARLDAWTSAPGRLSVPEREEILLGLHHGLSMRAIARALGRAPSTITRGEGERRTRGLSNLVSPPARTSLHQTTQVRQAGQPGAV